MSKCVLYVYHKFFFQCAISLCIVCDAEILQIEQAIDMPEICLTYSLLIYATHLKTFNILMLPQCLFYWPWT